jgi:hypothetical protein
LVLLKNCKSSIYNSSTFLCSNLVERKVEKAIKTGGQKQEYIFDFVRVPRSVAVAGCSHLQLKPSLTEYSATLKLLVKRHNNGYAACPAATPTDVQMSDLSLRQGKLHDIYFCMRLIAKWYVVTGKKMYLPECLLNYTIF